MGHVIHSAPQDRDQKKNGKEKDIQKGIYRKGVGGKIVFPRAVYIFDCIIFGSYWPVRAVLFLDGPRVSLWLWWLGAREACWGLPKQPQGIRESATPIQHPQEPHGADRPL